MARLVKAVTAPHILDGKNLNGTTGIPQRLRNLGCHCGTTLLEQGPPDHSFAWGPNSQCSKALLQMVVRDSCHWGVGGGEVHGKLSDGCQ